MLKDWTITDPNFNKLNKLKKSKIKSSFRNSKACLYFYYIAALYIPFILTKQEHIAYWVDTAKKDWRAVQHMYQSKDYLHALFFAHLVLEKLCKALWVKNNKGDTPPKIHNLIKILDEANIKYSTDQLDFMIIMNTFQLEGRYPDYMQRLYRTYKSKNTGEILRQVKNYKRWLQEQLLMK